MTIRGSWFETADPADIIKAAKEQGAKLYDGRSPFGEPEAGGWRLLDMDDSPLWWALFDTEADAARAFLYWQVSRGEKR